MEVLHFYKSQPLNSESGSCKRWSAESLNEREPGARQLVLIFGMKISKKQVASPWLIRPCPLGVGCKDDERLGGGSAGWREKADWQKANWTGRAAGRAMGIWHLPTRLKCTEITIQTEGWLGPEQVATAALQATILTNEIQASNPPFLHPFSSVHKKHFIVA